MFLAFFFPVLALQAQNNEVAANPADGLFPLTLVLEGARNAGEPLTVTAGEVSGLGFWRPDWPLVLPPDAFSVRSGQISGCRLEGEGISLVFRLGLGGLVEEFPFMVNGRMAQVSLVYRGQSEIEQMNLSFGSGEGPWKLEFLEYRDFFPYLVRASFGELWYFIYFSAGVNEIIETWYDAEGNALGAFGFYLAETGKSYKIREIRDFFDPGNFTAFHYDSWGLLTESLGPLGFFKVLFYKEKLPRYWERRPFSRFIIEDVSGETLGETGNFYLQWDGEAFLLRILGVEENPDPYVDYRYEYQLDEMGNWTERRETRMIRNLGLLVPTPGPTFTRVLEYR